MKVIMDFDRRRAEISVAMAKGVSCEVTKEMSDNELACQASKHIFTYGFCNMEIIEEDT